jgi:hypothetical protein
MADTATRFPRTVRLLCTAFVATAAIIAPHASATAASPSPKASSTAGPPPPSAIGGVLLSWLAVSPAYRHSGLVAAVGSKIDCSKNCIALWVSHDGGASWHQAAARNWDANRFVIGVDANGHETMVGTARDLLMRSTDDGETWTTAGLGGQPSLMPTFASDGGLAVASVGKRSDYVVQKGTFHDVSGSNGVVTDLQYAFSPSYPSGGSFSPALLVGLEPRSSNVLVLHCTAELACSTPTTLSVPAPSGLTTAGSLLYVPEDYAQHGTVFANTPVGIHKSTDGGVTFTPLAVAPTEGAARTATPMMALAPGYREGDPNSRAYVSVFQIFDPQSKTAHTGGGVYMTTDGGTHWSPLATSGPFAGGSQAVAAAPDGRLFAGYYDNHGHAGLLCSVDGASWKASCPAVGDHVGSGTGPKSGPGAGGTPCLSTGCPTAASGAQRSTADQGSAAGAPAGAHDVTPASAQAATSTGRSSKLWLILAAAAGGLVLVSATVSWIRRRASRHESRGT